MDSQPWDKAKLEEWKKFWESEMGQEALGKMRIIREQCLKLSLNAVNPDEIQFYVGRAAGIDLVLQDIDTGIRAASETKRE